MSKTVTKADIAKSICAQSEMKQQHAKKVLDAMLGIMKKALKEEKEMLLSGFGKFEAFTKKNRKGRNPQTRPAKKSPLTPTTCWLSASRASSRPP